MRESVCVEPEAMERSMTDTVAPTKKKKQKKRWSDLSPRQQEAVVVGAIAELVVTTIALADLARRPAGQVRGPKLTWLVSFVMQPIGPILYLLAGRRRTTR
jgi:Phospholipase_D-nuclease N-terminal